MKIALTGGIPDRVPCCPDISNMIPCRLTGKPFQDIYLRNDPPLWRAYIDAVDRLKIDGWFIYGYIGFHTDDKTTSDWTIEKKGDREILYRILHTPAGDLRSTQTFYPADPPTPTEKLIKDFKDDFPKLKYLFPEITGYDKDAYNEMYAAFGDRGLFAICLMPPGFSIYNELFEGNLQALTYAYYDYPELFAEFHEINVKYTLRQLDMVLDAKPESVLTGGSGAITLASHELFDTLAFPTLKTIADECNRTGIITGVHCCGKEMHLIKRCAEETGLNYVNPLEIAPQGDSELKTAKKLYGKKIALMGNLHTTNMMLKGSREFVKLKSLEALAAAAEGGGFVLSTGDQCGRDTPFENLFAMIETARTYGRY